MGLAIPDSVGALQQLLRQCTVRVNALASMGTGFFVAPSLVVTCAHVVKDILPEQDVLLQWDDAAPMHGRVTKKFPDPYTEGSFPDIALIKVRGDVPERPCVLLDVDDKYQARDPLYTWGYSEKSPGGESLTPNCEGEGRRGPSPDAWLIKFRAAQTLAGMSGAPLLNDHTGRVCGMIKLTRDNESDLGGWAIRAAVILERFPELRDLQKDYHKSHPQWKSARTTTYVTVPPLPDNYVERAEAIADLRRALTTNRASRSIAMIASQGMGGLGKTLLAQAICHDDAVKEAFPDGIVWLPIGKESTRGVATLMCEVGKTFGEDLAADISDLSATNWYKTAMRQRAALVVLDDVWRASDLDSFRAEAPRSRVLFTTRDASIADAYGAQVLTPGLLSEKQSREVLARWSGLQVDDLPADADDLMRESGGLAFAVATIGAMLRGKQRTYWQYVHKLLRDADLGKIRQQFPDYPYPDLLRALQVSVDALV